MKAGKETLLCLKSLVLPDCTGASSMQRLGSTMPANLSSDPLSMESRHTQRTVSCHQCALGASRLREAVAKGRKVLVV